MTRYWDTSQWQFEFISKARKTAKAETDALITFFPKFRWFNRYPLTQLHELIHLYRHLDSKQPDIVHSYFFWPIVYGRILKSLGVIRILVENREDQGFDWGRHEYAILRLTRTLPDTVICVSDAVRAEVIRKENIDSDRIVVIPNGVEMGDEQASIKIATREELGLEEDQLVVGMVANYDRPVKGISYFLESIPLIIRKVSSARFLIIGRGGDQEGPMRERAKELGIEPYVIFAGYQENIHKFYAIMNISTMTSLSEGLSIAILESMSHCLPVVVTRVGGNPEIVVDGKTGYMVPPGDVPAFAKIVVHLLRDPSQRFEMGQEGRRRVEKEFHIKVVAQKYMQLYNNLVEPVV